MTTSISTENELRPLAIASNRIWLPNDSDLPVVDGVEMPAKSKRTVGLLRFFILCPEQTYNPLDIGEEVWGYRDGYVAGSVRVTLCGLRKVLGPELGDRKEGAIRTNFPLGYRSVIDL